jgi:hypothetical protein
MSRSGSPGTANDIRRLAFNQRANAILPCHDLGVQRSGRNDRVHRKVAELHASRELLRIGAVGDHQGIGDTGTANPTFGQFVAVGTATNAIPAFANIDPPRMFQLQVWFIF